MKNYKIGFIVLVHHNPNQFEKLLRLLVHPDAQIVVHVDASADEGLFKKAASGLNITFCAHRFHSYWGGFGIIQATLACVDEISKNTEVSRVVLLSGSCLPLYSVDDLMKLYKENEGTCYIDSEGLNTTSTKLIYERIQFGWVRWGGGKHQVSPLPRMGWRLSVTNIRLLLSFFMRAIYNKKYNALNVFMHAKLPALHLPLDFAHGSQWWSLPMPVLKSMIDFYRSNSAIDEFFSTTLIPDEMFFQTILKTAIKGVEELQIVRTHTYASWGGVNAASPDFLDDRDAAFFDSLRMQGYFFCRKFESSSGLLTHAGARE